MSQLKLLVAEQQRREEEREGQFRKRVEEYSRLESELKAAILDFRKQQDQLRWAVLPSSSPQLTPPAPSITLAPPPHREKEGRLDKSLREVAAEKGQVSSRVHQEVHSVRETYAMQLEVERAKVSELEQQVKRLMGQVGGARGRGGLEGQVGGARGRGGLEGQVGGARGRGGLMGQVGGARGKVRLCETGGWGSAS